MHLAVCDDNIADRKQTERLLGRNRIGGSILPESCMWTLSATEMRFFPPL